MRNFILVGFVIGLFWGCGKDQPQNLMAVLVKADGQDVKKYISAEIPLDVDVLALSNALTAQKSYDVEDLNKAKAAIYRFYRHVKTIDGKYVCSLKSGREVNISERLFSSLKASLKEGNDWIDTCRDEGREVLVPEINEDYFNALLQ